MKITERERKNSGKKREREEERQTERKRRKMLDGNSERDGRREMERS